MLPILATDAMVISSPASVWERFQRRLHGRQRNTVSVVAEAGPQIDQDGNKQDRPGVGEHPFRGELG